MSVSSEPSSDFPIPNLPIDSDLRACWDLSAWIGKKSSDDHLRSYTTLLIALLHGDNDLSRWFLHYARAAGIDLAAIYESRQFRLADLRELKARKSAGELPDGKPSHTVSAANMLKGGADLMSETGSGELGLRHLIGAYFYRIPQAHLGQMREWRFDPQRDGSAFVRQMTQRYPKEIFQWKRVHALALKDPPDMEGVDPILPPKISGFAADTAIGDDRLDIEDDIYALSALICSTKVDPPLSIGLFGDWGSGKSFYIQQLKRGVEWISGDARRSSYMQKDIHFYKRVVQIEFNAWNYSGGNLWASLVQHILENMRLTENEHSDLVADRVNHLKKRMHLEEEVRKAATTRKEIAEKEVEASQKRLTTLRKEHSDEVEELERVVASDVLATVQLDGATVEELNVLRTELKLPEATASAGEFLAALEGTRKTLGRFTALIEYVPEKERKSFVRSSALLLMAPPAAAIVLGLATHLLAPHIGSLSAFVGWISTSLGLGARWLKKRTEELNKPLAALESLRAKAMKRVEEVQQKHKAEAAGLEQKITLARNEILAAQAAQQKAESNLQQIKAELESTTPARVLADFVKERADSQDYRQHLGLPAVIRRDFENISKMVWDENRNLDEMTDLKQEETNANVRVNRIVLYIDDLDRCPEPLVIEVLKAVHLLLAFPLFVVVVAVDARWVSRSLAKQFPGLLTSQQAEDATTRNDGGTENATPGDYLEKIFQIPLWLRPPDEGAVERMVRALVDVKPASTGGTNGGHRGKGEILPMPSQDEKGVFKRKEHDSKAPSLDIQSEELEHMATLAPLLGRSPRALKRFVNIYRLMKASLSSEEEAGFLDERESGVAPFKVVQLLLALVTRMPGSCDPILEGLIDASARYRPPGPGVNGIAKAIKEPVMFHSVLSKIISLDSVIEGEENDLAVWLDRHIPLWKSVPAAEFLDWVPRVARYSYTSPWRSKNSGRSAIRTAMGSVGN